MFVFILYLFKMRSISPIHLESLANFNDNEWKFSLRLLYWFIAIYFNSFIEFPLAISVELLRAVNQLDVDTCQINELNIKYSCNMIWNYIMNEKKYEFFQIAWFASKMMLLIVGFSFANYTNPRPIIFFFELNLT